MRRALSQVSRRWLAGWYWVSLLLLQAAVFLPSELVFRRLVRGAAPRTR
jgi:hypothetical protein